jgi:hypothetical protein
MMGETIERKKNCIFILCWEKKNNFVERLTQENIIKKLKNSSEFSPRIKSYSNLLFKLPFYINIIKPIYLSSHF